MCILLLALLWIKLSCLGVLAAHTPWSLSPLLLWLDSCCLSSENLELIAAGFLAEHAA